MTSANLRNALTLAAVFVFTAALHAQLPTNNPVWKMRCDLLASKDADIAAGKAPKELVDATKGVPGAQTSVLALDRAQENQHYVACTLFYLSAIAQRAGNGGKVDTSSADNELTLARAEAKLAAGGTLSTSEKLGRSKAKLGEEVGHSHTLTSPQTTAVLAAATTMPITLTTPTVKVASAKPVAKKH